MIAAITLLFAMAGQSHHVSAEDAQWAYAWTRPAEPDVQLAILHTLTTRKGEKSCGSTTFYPWFANTLSAVPPGSHRSPGQQLQAISGSFSYEATRLAFRSGIAKIEELARKEPGESPYPSAAKPRRFCSSYFLRNGNVNVEYSRPFRVANFVFIEERTSSASGGAVDILAFELTPYGEWRVFDVALIYIVD